MTTTIQKTSKPIKAAGCVGGAIMALGLLLLLGKEASGGFILATGMLIVAGSRISKWWQHE